MIELTFKGNTLEEVFDNMRKALGADAPKEEPKKELITLDMVRTLAVNLLKDKKQVGVKAVLKELGVKRVSDIPENDVDRAYEMLSAIKEV